MERGYKMKRSDTKKHHAVHSNVEDHIRIRGGEDQLFAGVYLIDDHADSQPRRREQRDYPKDREYCNGNQTWLLLTFYAWFIERGQLDMVHRKAIIEIDIPGRTCNAGADPYFAIQLVSSKGSFRYILVIYGWHSFFFALGHIFSYKLLSHPGQYVEHSIGYACLCCTANNQVRYVAILFQSRYSTELFQHVWADIAEAAKANN